MIDFLDTERPERVFAWIHYLEPHEPYDPHPGGPDRSRPDTERYDGEVRYVDQQVARLTEYLLRTRPGALLLFAADHGEEPGAVAASPSRNTAAARHLERDRQAQDDCLRRSQADL